MSAPPAWIWIAVFIVTIAVAKIRYPGMLEWKRVAKRCPSCGRYRAVCSCR